MRFSPAEEPPAQAAARSELPSRAGEPSPAANVHRLPARAARPPLAEADAESFRAAFRELASGVCVVTIGAGSERSGLTAVSVAPLSAEPPALLVCVDRSAPSYPEIQRVGRFAVNVLAADQREIAERFSSGAHAEGAERFAGCRSVILPDGGFCLADSIAALDCVVEEQIDRHASGIVIGRVRRVLARGGAGALLSWRGAYEQVGWTETEISRAIGLSPTTGARPGSVAGYSQIR
jgi:flavin reductase (DIM6/NTAB) family NADH-FMN oxidoreductase RutF